MPQFEVTIARSAHVAWSALPPSMQRELKKQLEAVARLIALRAYLEYRYGTVSVPGFEAQYAIDTVGRKLEVIELRPTA